MVAILFVDRGTVFIKLTVFAAVVSIKKSDEFLDHKFQNKSEI